MPSSADRDLLFGIFALQLDFIIHSQLEAGVNAAISSRSRNSLAGRAESQLQSDLLVRGQQLHWTRSASGRVVRGGHSDVTRSGDSGLAHGIIAASWMQSRTRPAFPNAGGFRI